MFENLSDDILSLVKDARTGRIKLGDSPFERHLEEDLSRVVFSENGQVIHCSELVQRVALNRGESSREKLEFEDPQESIDLKSYNLELFTRMDDAFKILTDKPATSYSSLDDFHEEFEKSKYGNDRLKIFSRKINQLYDFYVEYSRQKKVEIPRYSGSLVVSGPRFYKETLNSVTSMALYAESILIPDPVLPWLEVERREEANRIPELLENLFQSLRLKPLIDKDIPGTPVALIPTWSKTTEVFNAVEMWEMNQSVTRFFSYYLDTNFRDLSEVHDFASQEPSRFQTKIKASNLFQPFGGTGDVVDLPFEHAVALQRKNYENTRDESFHEFYESLSDQDIAILNIRERLTPVYNLVKQSSELNSQPMSWLPAQWFFLKKYSESLEAQQFNPETTALLESLDSKELKWLSKVPIQDLARLRRDGVNTDFRTRMNELAAELSSAERANSRSCAQQVSRGLHTLINEHQSQIRAIQEDYQTKYKQTAVGAWVGFAGLFLPMTAPIVASVTPVAVAVKYYNDKSKEKLALKRERRSLLGVLAAAARN